MSKKADKATIKATLCAQGIDFSEDFHALPSSQVELLVEASKVCGYRKPAQHGISFSTWQSKSKIKLAAPRKGR